MSGSYTVDMSGYYTTSSFTYYPTTSFEYTPIGTEYKIYATQNADGTYGRPWRTTGTIPSNAKLFYTMYTAGSAQTGYSRGDARTGYSRTKANDITLKLTGSKSLTNQIFEASDTDDTIEYDVTGVTFTKQ